MVRHRQDCKLVLPIIPRGPVHRLTNSKAEKGSSDRGEDGYLPFRDVCVTREHERYRSHVSRVSLVLNG